MPTAQPFQCYSPVTIAPGESYHINSMTSTSTYRLVRPLS
jgi:hypothetical protein